MSLLHRQSLLRYGLSLLAAGLAFVLTLWFDTLLRQHQSIFFFSAVVISAWYGGLGPALFTTLLSALSMAYFITAPAHSFQIGIEGLFDLSMFSAVAFLTSSLAEHRRRSAELERRNSEILRNEVEARTEALRQKERELEQNRKLEALGQLASGIAHDFNNIMTGIAGLVYDLQNEKSLHPSARRDLISILEATSRATTLTRQLLAFGRRTTAAPEPIHLNQALGDMMRLMRRLVREDIAMEFRPGADLAPVSIDRTQLQQIVMNLILNARDAMPAGGTLRVETSMGGDPGPRVVLRVSDTGVGIAPEVRARIFDPFFTTKPKGQGTGMGLATVRTIVEACGGTIQVTSEPHSGSTFDITFPVQRMEAYAECPPPDENTHVPDGAETILVVDDDEMVRNVLARALTRRGYHVVAASDGEQALTISQERRERIDLLLTDLVMPRMNGRQAAQAVTRLHPETAVLFMSGYAEEAMAHQGLLGKNVLFVEKTISPPLLVRKVREVLDARPRQDSGCGFFATSPFALRPDNVCDRTIKEEPS